MEEKGGQMSWTKIFLRGEFKDGEHPKTKRGERVESLQSGGLHVTASCLRSTKYTLLTFRNSGDSDCGQKRPP